MKTLHKRNRKHTVTRKKHTNANQRNGTRSIKKTNRTSKNNNQNRGGGPREDIRDAQFKKNRFRRNFKDLILQINNKKNVNQAIQSIIKDFSNSENINTLIPISNTGIPLDVATYTSKNPIVDFVSPVIVLFDNLTGKISEKDMVRLLTTYYKHGGNMNAPSNRFKITPFENEVHKKRIQNIKLLLNKDYSFHIMEEGLSSEIKDQLTELIPTEQKIMTIHPEQEQEQEQEPAPVPVHVHVPTITIDLHSVLPENKQGYDRNDVPTFWKPLFDEGEELVSLKNAFMELYQQDQYKDLNKKKLLVCEILEKLIPGYLTKDVMHDNESVKTMVTVNIVSCYMMLLYGIINYKLYNSNQEYLLLFKGGRAVQLSVSDIPNVGKYFSEDADLLIIPNANVHASYNEDKMKNLACHIAYLIKWCIPPEIDILVNLPDSPINQNSEITKLVYHEMYILYKMIEGKQVPFEKHIYKAVSDIGFGPLNEEVARYFNNPTYSPFYVESFETTALYITPTMDDVLCEKIYLYAKYYMIGQKIMRKEPITDKGLEDITQTECGRILGKFKRAIKHIIESIIKRDYINLEMIRKDEKSDKLVSSTVMDRDQMNTLSKGERLNQYKQTDEISRFILRGYLSRFEEYSNAEKEDIIQDMYS